MVSPQDNPSGVVSRAAYLLFYRRRSDGPLGGPRLQEMMEKLENRSEDDATESGEDQRLVVGSSQRGSSSAGIGAAAIHHEGLGSANSAMTGVAADEGDELSSYDRPKSEHIQNSIEDVRIADGYRNGGLSSPNAVAQSWSFADLGDNPANSTQNQSGDYASDDAQGGSTDNERDGVLGQESDTPTALEADGEPFSSTCYVDSSDPSCYEELPAADDITQAAMADIAHQTWDRHRESVMTVAVGADQVSEDGAVAEIRLDENENDSPKLD
jgi:ubiquitin carboxyl-terminal hydrolase 4/11